MKKALFGLWAVLCMVCFFTACSDEEETVGPGNWQDLSKTYDGRYVQLILGENVVPLYGKSVEVDASSETAAKISLHNLLPGNKLVVVNATLQRNEADFGFAGQTNLEGENVSIQGSIKKGVLSMVIHRQLDCPVVAPWKLKYTHVSTNAAAEVFVQAKTGNPEVDMLVNSVAGPVIGQLLAKKVDAVHVDFRENGTLGISWKKVGEAQMTDINKYLEIVNLQYCLMGENLFLAIDKTFIEVVVNLGKEVLAKQGIDVEELRKLLVDLGGYYGLPLHVSQKDEIATFYADKKLLLPVISLAMPFIESKIPAGFENTIQAILTLLPTAEKLELGLSFEK